MELSHGFNFMCKIEKKRALQLNLEIIKTWTGQVSEITHGTHES